MKLREERECLLQSCAGAIPRRFVRVLGHSLGQGMTGPTKPRKVDREQPCASVAFYKHHKPSKLVAASS